VTGDERFDDFYGHDYPRIVGALALITGSVDEAQDAVDESVARAWSRLRRGDDLENLGAWVRVVAVNVARGRIRTRVVERRARARLAAAADEISPIDSGLTRVDVQRALVRLSRRQREVVVLYYLLDLPVAQVATELHVEVGTVKSMLSRARAALAEVLETDREEADDDLQA
jgi:RNA polymerase sigma-70 factor (ECF subfamily)